MRKQGWTYKKLGEVCKIARGGSPRPIKNYITTSSDGLNWIKIGDTDPQGKYIFSTKEKIRKEGLKKTRWVEENEFLLSNSMSFGRPYILKTNGCIHDGWLVLRDYQDSLFIDFFYYLLISPFVQKQFKIKAQGSTVSNLNTDRVTNIDITFPSLEEQERIVARLDAAFAQIDELRANAEKQLEEARALFNAALNEEMKPKKGWEEKTVGDIFKTYSGGTPIKSNKSYYENGNIPWIRSGEVCKRFITESELFITEEGLKNSSAKFYPIDTVLIAMYGATAAQVGILKFPATSNQAVCGILPNKNYLPDFVYFWFKHIEEQLASQAQGGAQPNISQEKIKRVLIPFISLSEQEAIVERLDGLSERVKELEEIARTTVKECDALKQAILRQY